MLEWLTRQNADLFMAGFTDPLGYRASKIRNGLGHAQKYLIVGDYAAADRIAEKHAQLRGFGPKYEALKFHNIKQDLGDIEYKIGFRPNDEQIAALVATDQAILVQARAGSGKTSVIALKVRQLIKQYGFKPEEILVLAFNNKAAQEFADRINKYTNEQGENKVYAKFKENASTFHSLAYRLVQSNQDIVAHDLNDYWEFVVSNQQRFIADIIEEVAAEKDPKMLKLIDAFFRSPRVDKELSDFKNAEDYYLWRRNIRYVTLGGDRVKSIPETYIADFFFENELTYQGHPLVAKYEWNVLRADKRYRPDFSLLISEDEPKLTAILDYFGISEKHPTDPSYMSAEDAKKYLETKKWKKNYCAINNIPLIELSVDEYEDVNRDRELFEHEIARKLRTIGIQIKPLGFGATYDKLIQSHTRFSELGAQLANFINRVKKYSWTQETFDKRLRDLAIRCDLRLYNFLSIAAEVYRRYVIKLEERRQTDFDDLLLQACIKVSQTEGNCSLKLFDRQQPLNKLKAILIDEYQDFSELFNSLIQTLRKYNPDIQIYCVGDDWQAINGFAGSDVKFFNRFAAYFGGPTVPLRINNRSSKRIVEHANSIMDGLGAGGISDKKKPNGEVYLIPTEFVNWKNNIDLSATDTKYRDAANAIKGRPELSNYLKTTESIIAKHSDEKVCLLFRTNRYAGVNIEDIEKILKQPGRQVECSTVHSYKGKEQGVVIVEASKSNFPYLHPDNDLLKILEISLSDLLAEEHRLFYVAITRAKKSLYLVYDKNDGYSDFIDTKKWNYS